MLTYLQHKTPKYYNHSTCCCRNLKQKTFYLEIYTKEALLGVIKSPAESEREAELSVKPAQRGVECPCLHGNG